MQSNQKSMFKYLIFGNKLVLTCIFFTVATMLDVIICTVLKTQDSTTFIHLIDRMLLSVIATVPLSLFKHFEKLSIWAIFPIWYVACCVLAELYVYVSGFYMELHPNAYHDIFRAVTIMFVAIMIGALIIDLTRTAIANKELKKIQLTAPDSRK